MTTPGTPRHHLFGTPRIGDAFGELLLAAHTRGGLPATAYEVTERYDAYISVRDAWHYFAPVTDASAEARILDQARGRVLDIGCAAGRHLTYLTEHRGVEALGLDGSLGATQICARRGLDAIHTDIHHPPDLGRFDTLLLLGGAGLGLLGSPTRAPRLLSTLAGMAAPEALILAEGFDPTHTTDPAYLAYQHHNRSLGYQAGQVTIRILHLDAATDWIDLWYLPVAELRDLLDASPWRLDDVWPQPDGVGYHVRMAARA